MKFFEDAAVKMEEIEALFCAVEKALPEIDGNPKERMQIENLIYILWDKVKELNKGIDELSGHIQVCDAIYAVNRVDELKREIELLKANK